MNTGFVRLAVATVPTVYGIETNSMRIKKIIFMPVATVPTVYGIETTIDFVKSSILPLGCNSTYRLRY